MSSSSKKTRAFLDKDRLRHHLIRLNQTDEERQSVRDRKKVLQRKYRSQMTPDEKQKYLQRRREYEKKWRASKKKNQISITAYKSAFNSHPCDDELRDFKLRTSSVSYIFDKLHELEQQYSTRGFTIPSVNQDLSLTKYNEAVHALDVSHVVASTICDVCKICVPCVSKPEVKISKRLRTEFDLDLIRKCLPRFPDNSFSVCSLCDDSLSKKKFPKFALTNGFDVGIIDLPELTFCEKMVISRVRFPLCVVKMVKSKLMSHLAFKGHMFLKLQDPSKILDLLPTLPISPTEIGSYIQIVLLNSNSMVDGLTTVRSLFTVRREVIRVWLIHLKTHHPGYKEITIDKANLASYPENGAPPSIEDSVTFHTDKDNQDAKDESGDCNNDSNDYSSVQSINDMQKSFMVEENGASMFMNEVYDQFKDGIRNPTLDKENAIAMIPGSSFLDPKKHDVYAIAFPHLFPFGKGTHATAREVKVSFEEYVQHRLISCSSSNFKQDFYFQFMAYDQIQRQQVFQAIHCKVKAADNNSLTLIDSLTETSIQNAIDEKAKGGAPRLLSDLSKQISMVGGKAPFSQLSKKRNKQELLSLLVSKGTPQLFITITPDDSTNVLSYVMSLKDPKTFDPFKDEISDKFFRKRQAAQNPVSVAQFFNKLIDTILTKYFPLGQPSIFGTTNCYYGMVETQNRGTLHVHLLVWIDGFCNADLLYRLLEQDNDLQDRLVKYVESIISTGSCTTDICTNGNSSSNDHTVDGAYEDESDLETIGSTLEDIDMSPVQPDRHFQIPISKRDLFLPNYFASPCSTSTRFSETSNRILEAAQMGYQRHKHTLSCFKGGRKKCRYRMPEDIQEKSFWDPTSGNVVLRKTDGWISNYNQWLTLTVNANTDIKFLTSGLVGLAIVYYVCNYVTKNSVGMDNMFFLQRLAIKRTTENPLLTNAMLPFSDRQKKARDFFIRFFMALQNMSQVAAPEISTKLLKLPMCYKSHSFAPLFIFAAQRSLEAFQVNDDDESIIQEFTIDSNGSVRLDVVDDYKARPPQLENICLYDFVSLLEKSDVVEEVHFPLQHSHPRHRSYGYCVRKIPVIPTIYGHIPRKPGKFPLPKEKQKFESTVCMLFQPFRFFSDFAFEDFMLSASPRIKALVENLQLQHRTKEEAARHKEEMRKLDLFADSPAAMNDEHVDKDKLEHFRSMFMDDAIVDKEFPFLDFLSPGDIFPDFQRLDPSDAKALEILNSLTPAIPPDPSNNKSSFQSNELSYSEEQKLSWSVYFEKVHLPSISVKKSQRILRSSSACPKTTNLSNIKRITLVEDLIRKHTLNFRQSKAFRKISKHILDPSLGQLFMYVGGEGGTGKSRIINCITDLYQEFDPDGLHKMAFTGTASFNIGGKTIHSSIGLKKGNKRQKTEQQSNVTLTEANHAFWSSKSCAIIDEITFAPEAAVTSLHKCLCKVKGIPECDGPKTPFGGISVIMFGDFHQHLAIGKKIYESFLWTKLNCKMVLTQQYRAINDARFVTLLGNAKKRKPTREDLELLKSRIISNLHCSTDASSAWNNDMCPFISSRKRLNFVINNRRAYQKSSFLGQPLIIISAKDTIFGQRVSSSYVRQEIINQTTIPGNDAALYRTVHLCKGSKVTLTRNIPVLDNFGITNGVTGTVFDIIPSSTTHTVPNMNTIVHSEPPIILFKPDKPGDVIANLKYPGLPKGIVPIFPVTESVLLKLNSPEGLLNIRMIRQQIPFTGGYALTCYKAQGFTFDQSIIDLCDTVAGASAYVMLSRLTSLKGLFILRPFPESNLTCPFDPQLQYILQEMESLASPDHDVE